ncbi:phosphoglycerate kinase, partial [Candidatus Woesearchaeota archaeon]|nr:phosphoglycerate kinase [Candidatus Woesearchaeota archaeon]
DDCIDIEIPDSKIVLLENVRFHEDEESKDDAKREEFAKKLAGGAELYVNDAFGTCHRKHASVYDITKFLKSAAGFLVEKEINAMEPVRDNPEKPFALLLGGAKVEDKIKVIENMYPKVDMIIIGGAMAYAFFKAKAYEVGKSLCEGVDVAKEILEKYSDKLILPVDIVLDNGNIVDFDKIPKESSGLDIGPKTVELFKEKLKNVKTVFWNGPFGYFEKPPYDKGTNEIAEFLAELCSKNVVVVIGGGDSETAVEKLNLQDKFTHVSTGGGASLEFFEGQELPAIKALKENKEKFK